MSNNNLFVYARITPKDEHFEDAKNAILNILQLVRAEAGCRQFELHENEPGNTLFLYEEWVSDSALEEHYLTSHTSHVLESFNEWLSEPVDIIKMRKCIKA